MFKAITKALVAGTAACALMAGAAQAAPPMWVVKDGDSTIYLFGTIHLLKPDVQWRTPAMEAALGTATELYLETLEDEADEAFMMEMMGRYGLVPGSSLTSKLTAEEAATFRRMTQPLTAQGLPMEAVDMMRPWLVSILIELQAATVGGYTPEAGVESVLTPIARAQGDALKVMEESNEVLRQVANLPEAAQMAMLRETLESGSIEELNKAVQQWVSGDFAEFAKENAELKATAPEFYDVMLARRNAAWAGRIETMLKGSGVAFIAVGAGHLAGPDSVQAELTKRGITAERVQ